MKKIKLNNKTLSEKLRKKSPNVKSTSKYLGVSCKVNKFKKGCCKYWQVKTRKNGKSLYIGTFPYTLEGERQAALAYNKKAIELFGESTFLNVIK